MVGCIVVLLNVYVLHLFNGDTQSISRCYRQRDTVITTSNFQSNYDFIALKVWFSNVLPPKKLGTVSSFGLTKNDFPDK